MLAYHRQDFSPERLRAMYRLSVELGYRAIFFGEEQEATEPFVLWRHDVDLELPAMLALAELEAQENIRSTFFLMTRSWFYNLWSGEGRAAIARLKQLGHRLGLHCDLQLERNATVADAEVEERVDQDFSLLEVVFPGVFSRTVSFHNPPRNILRRSFATFYSTYQSKFFCEIKYLSDSNRRWREGPPEEWFDINKNPSLSILLHPVLWAYSGQTIADAIPIFLQARQERCRAMLIEDDVKD